jgi:hypothetical protein
MIKSLRVVMIVSGVIEILLGILLVIFPDKTASMSGVNEVSGYLKYNMALLGICLLVPSVFLIVAAGDPLRHISWVKFAIAWFIIGAVAGLYSIVKGNVEFSHAGTLVILHAVFAAALLALYPWRPARSVKPASS